MPFECSTSFVSDESSDDHGKQACNLSDRGPDEQVNGRRIHVQVRYVQPIQDNDPKRENHGDGEGVHQDPEKSFLPCGQLPPASDLRFPVLDG